MNSKADTKTMDQEKKHELKPKLRFPKFRDAGWWEERTLAEFLAESRILGSKGDTAKKITVKLWGKGVYEKNDEIQGSINTQYYRRKAGQFIYSKLDFLNQAFGIIPKNLHNYESTVDLPCFDINEKVNSIFLLEYVKRKNFYERLGETADGSRKARRIHADTFLSFPIFVPTIAEQKKIADCFSSIDDRITAETQKLSTLKVHKKGLMQQLFPAEGETVPDRRFPEFQDTEEWEEKKLKEVSVINQGLQIPISERFTSKVENSYFYITNEFLKKNSNNLFYIKDPSGSVICDKDDILMTRTGNTGQVVTGVIGVFHNNFFKIKLTQKIDKDFFIYFLRSQKTQVTILKLAGSSTIPDLNHGDFYKITIELPCITEQKKIAHCLCSLDELIAAQTQKIDILKTHKKGLMQQLFPAVEDAIE